MNDDIKGKITIRPTSSKLEHKGILIYLIGEIIKVGQKKGGKRFLALQNDLDSPGTIIGNEKEYNFCFTKVPLNFESFKGDYICVKYYIKVKIISSIKDIKHEEEFCVVNPQEQKVLDDDRENIKLCVGIQDLLKLSIDFEHKRYNYRGILEGTVTFHKVGLPLSFMELQIIKRENLQGEEDMQPYIIYNIV